MSGSFCDKQSKHPGDFALAVALCTASLVHFSMFIHWTDLKAHFYFSLATPWWGPNTVHFISPDQSQFVQSPFGVKHHVVVQYMAAGPKCPLPPPPIVGWHELRTMELAFKMSWQDGASVPGKPCGGWAQIEVRAHGLDDLRVISGPALPGHLLAYLPDNILS